MAVDPVDHGWHRPEVLDQGDLLADPLLDALIERDVGSPEAVDRLLRVADHEELAGYQLGVEPALRELDIRPRRQVDRDLGLERISVLELVDEDARPALLGAGPDVGAVAKEVARSRKEVMEGGDAAAAALGRVGEDEAAQLLQEAVEDLGPAGGEDGVDLVQAAPQFLSQPIKRRVAPVALLADDDRKVIQQQEGDQRLSLGVGFRQPFRREGDFAQLLVHAIGRLKAVVEVAAQGLQAVGHPGGSGQRLASGRRRPAGGGLDEVVVLVERPGDRLDLVRRELQEERVLDRLARFLVLGGGLEPGPEALPELEILLDLVECLKAGR